MLEGKEHALASDVAARAKRCTEAKRLARSLDIDAALLVTAPWGEVAWPVAVILSEQWILFFALAAPPDADFPPREWCPYPLTSNPYRASDVGRALLTALPELRRTDAAL